MAVKELVGLLAAGTKQSAYNVKPTVKKGNAFGYKRLKSLRQKTGFVLLSAPNSGRDRLCAVGTEEAGLASTPAHFLCL